MAMEINGIYNHPEIACAEKVSGNPAIGAEEKTKGAGSPGAADQAKETDSPGIADKAAGPKSSGRPLEPQDEYISSEKSGKKPTGLYRLGRDENGNRKIFYENPKAAHADEKEALKAEEERSGKDAGSKEPKANGSAPAKPEEICIGNTDKVDREIEKLKEKKQQLEQQIQSASGDEKKVRELEKKLAQVELELSQKDNDAYRRQHAVFSQTK